MKSRRSSRNAPVKYIVDVRRLSLKPGDVITLSVPGPLSEESIKWMKAAMETQFPDHKVMVFGDGIKVGVLRPE
jgi:phosphotransferase system HPr-like phosphotransfer protein